MYHWLIRRQIRTSFEEHLSRGEFERLVAGLSEDVDHVFPGDNALGGRRTSRKTVRQWFERLGRLFPVHEFRVLRVVARGWPWSTWVAVEWVADLVPAAGRAYRNEGAHWIHIRWGKVTYFHAYLDTQKAADALSQLAEHRVAEATAAPIED